MDLLLDACGAPGPLEVDVVYPSNPRPVRRVFHQPYLLIGRDIRCDLHLPYPRISPCHAYLQTIAGRVFCVDLCSPAGGLRSRWLKAGKALHIGDSSVRLAGDRPGRPPTAPGDANPLTPESARQHGCPATALELLNGQTARPPRPLTRLLTLLGQSTDCGLRLLGPSVSDFHCGLLC